MTICRAGLGRRTQVYQTQQQIEKLEREHAVRSAAGREEQAQSQAEASPREDGGAAAAPLQPAEAGGSHGGGGAAAAAAGMPDAQRQVIWHFRLWSRMA